MKMKSKSCHIHTSSGTFCTGENLSIIAENDSFLCVVTISKKKDERLIKTTFRSDGIIDHFYNDINGLLYFNF